MNTKQFMIGTAQYTKQKESGNFQRVKESFLIPALSFTDGETFMYGRVAEGIRGEFIVQSLATEQVDGIFYADKEVQDAWYKCKATTPDPDSDKDKNINLVYYVNADSVKKATETLELELRGLWSESEIKSVVISKIVDVFED